jgi:membrane-bound lytic murein transglycosylase MltF
VLFLAMLVIAAPPISAGSLAEIKRAQRLLVAASTADLPLEGDILRGFARALGVELSAVPEASVAASLQALQQGRADVSAGGLVAGRDHREGVAFTVEVFPTRFVAVSRAPSSAPSHIETIREASRILAPAATGASDAALAAKLPSFKTDKALADVQVLPRLRAEAGSVAIMGLFEALVARRADPALQIGAAIGERQSVAFAVRQADTDLLTALNGHLGHLRGSPSYRLVVARSLGEESLQILSRAHLEGSRP